MRLYLLIRYRAEYFIHCKSLPYYYYCYYYSAPVGERSIAISLSVCLPVCLSASISLEPLDRSARIFLCRSPVAVARSSGCVAIRSVCTSGFTHDVTFGRSGPYGDAWLAALRYPDGVYDVYIWMPCCYCYYCYLYFYLYPRQRRPRGLKAKVNNRSWSDHSSSSVIFGYSHYHSYNLLLADRWTQAKSSNQLASENRAVD